MLSASTTQTLTQLSYLVAAALFILGLKRMSSPVTAVSGVRWAGVGMVLATVATLVFMGASTLNLGLVMIAILAGGTLAWVSGKRVAMTDMPQMIALYNGMGGGAAAAIAAVELYGGNEHNVVHVSIAAIGGFIGAVSFSGSLIAFAKLQGLITKSVRFGGQKILNLAILLVTVGLGIMVISSLSVGAGVPLVSLAPLVSLFFVFALILGVSMTLPIGGADMPVVISLYNALTGLAVGFEGFVLDNAAMIIAGTVVGAAGTLLTQLMAKAMNRSLGNVLFSNFGETPAGGGGITGSQKAIEASDAGVMMAYSQKIIVVPGYGMAVAQAQHKVWELSQLLLDRGVKVRFAIHPVAGRMPGHMNVLLAEAGVPYDLISDLEEINAEFETADVALIIGANDVVNPDARSNKSSPIYGMPILNADKAKNVIVIKRGQGQGFSGIDNALFVLDQTRMLYGDAQAAVNQLIQAVKAAG
jgi:H+-translocating NAD(P) transhydrogenase subunit beta